MEGRPRCTLYIPENDLSVRRSRTESTGSDFFSNDSSNCIDFASYRKCFIVKSCKRKDIYGIFIPEK